MRSAACAILAGVVLLQGVALSLAHATVHGRVHHAGPMHFHLPRLSHGPTHFAAHRAGRGHAAGEASHPCTAGDHDGNADRATAPAHDRDAIYVDDDASILTSANPQRPVDRAAGWLVSAAWRAHVTPPPAATRTRRVRPPGDGPDAIHKLLPHVLRV